MEKQETMLKYDIIKKMAELADGTQTEAERWLDAFLGTMDYCAETNKKMNVVGYFVMEVKETEERVGRNPQTQEKIIIPAKKVVKLKISNRLKNKAN